MPDSSRPICRVCLTEDGVRNSLTVEKIIGHPMHSTDIDGWSARPESREYRATHNAVLVVHREESQFRGELRHAGDRWPWRINWSRRFPSDSAAVPRYRTGDGYGEPHRDDTTYRRSSCLADTAKCKSLRLAFAKRKNHSLFRQSSIQRRLPLSCPGGAKRGDVMRESRMPTGSGWR